MKLQNHCRWWLQPWNWKMLAPWKKSFDKPRQHIKKQRHYFANKGPSVKAMVFLVVMYGCESWIHKEGWALKNWCFWIVLLEKTLENPLDCKEIQSANPKANQPLIFIGSTDAEAAAPILWPTWCEELIYWKRLWYWERLRAGGERAGREWDGWMASLPQWTWVWTNSRR